MIHFVNYTLVLKCFKLEALLLKVIESLRLPAFYVQKQRLDDTLPPQQAPGGGSTHEAKHAVRKDLGLENLEPWPW